MPTTDATFAQILAEALAAGAVAGAAAQPRPMFVYAGSTLVEEVSDGVCGFGWVTFPATSAFGRWAKAEGHARAGYPKGCRIGSKLLTQSLVRNEAWAFAVADVLNAYGIKAEGHSRID